MKKMPVKDQRVAINQLKEIYPSSVPHTIGLEHCLNVLYNNQEIQLLIGKMLKERDAANAKKEGEKSEGKSSRGK